MHLGLSERRFLTAALNLHKIPALSQHKITIHLRRRIFDVAEIQQRLALQDTRANGRYFFLQRLLGELPFFEQSVKRHRRGHAGTRDRRCPSSTVGLEHIAVDPKRLLTQLFQIHDCPQTTTDEPLNLRAPSVHFSSGAIAVLPLQRRIREHGILRREPATLNTLHLHPARHFILDRGGANDPRVSERHQHRGRGMRSHVHHKTYFSQLIRGASVGSCHEMALPQDDVSPNWFSRLGCTLDHRFIKGKHVSSHDFRATRQLPAPRHRRLLRS